MVDGRALAELLGARHVAVPRVLVRAVIATLWHASLLPTHPTLLDLFLDLPTMDVGRARAELGWVPRHSALDAVSELLDGLRTGAGGPTPALADDTPARRLDEVRTGVGERP